MKGKLSGAPTPLPDGCGPASGAAVPTTSTSSETAVFPEGLYRADLTATDLIEKGLDPRTAYALAGIVTLTFEDGKWRAQTRGVADCGGTYSVAAGRISLRHDVAQCGEAAGTIVMTARWAFEDGELRFFDIRRGRPLEWGSKPWKKID